MKMQSIFDVDFFGKALMNEAYPGKQVQHWAPYSFHSAEIAPGEFSMVPKNSNTVYFGYLKTAGTVAIGVIVDGVEMAMATPVLSTPVFFDSLGGIIGDNFPVAIQFIGVRITVNAFGV